MKRTKRYNGEGRYAITVSILKRYHEHRVKILCLTGGTFTFLVGKITEIIVLRINNELSQ